MADLTAFLGYFRPISTFLEPAALNVSTTVTAPNFIGVFPRLSLFQLFITVIFLIGHQTILNWKDLNFSYRLLPKKKKTLGKSWDYTRAIFLSPCLPETTNVVFQVTSSVMLLSLIDYVLENLASDTITDFLINELH